MFSIQYFYFANIVGFMYLSLLMDFGYIWLFIRFVINCVMERLGRNRIWGLLIKGFMGIVVGFIVFMNLGNI